MSQLIVQARGLCLGYEKGKVAAGPLDLEIREGEALGILGESGAGKSTLGYEILGLLQEKGGSRVGGDLHCHLDPLEIGFIPQDPLSSLDPLFSIGSQMKELGADASEIQTALRRVHLSLDNISLKSYPHELSGGMRQRLVIAMALLRSPRLVIADEPTSSLDVTLQAEILKLFREIHAEGVAFLFITHHVLLAANFCDRLAVMQAGSIVETGTPREIMETPRHAYTAALVAAVPRL